MDPWETDLKELVEAVRVMRILQLIEHGERPHARFEKAENAERKVDDLITYHLLPPIPPPFDRPKGGVL